MGLKVSLFTDTYADLNGVSRFVQQLADTARVADADLQVLTSSRLVGKHPKRNVTNYRPHAARAFAVYPDQEVVWPPAWTMLRDTLRRDPDVIHASTPGPVGMVGVLAAALLDKPLTGVYHTDFPAYVRDHVPHRFVHRLTDGFIRSFYRKFSGIFTRSTQYLDVVKALGLDPHVLAELQPGMDTQAFHPRHRRPGFWTRYGLTDRPKVLYVGRVSKEKNLPFLREVWTRLHAHHAAADLVVVGDGPYLDDLRRDLSGRGVTFLGRRTGDELAALYANADLFVFPSVTDTLGQVVMEAQASGIPCIVSNQGGPQWVVQDNVTGRVLPATDADAWAACILDWLDHPDHRAALGATAHAAMQQRGFDRSFHDWWELQTEAWRRHHAKWNALSSPYIPAEAGGVEATV